MDFDLHPYKLQLTQKLKVSDSLRRFAFAEKKILVVFAFLTTSAQLIFDKVYMNNRRIICELGANNPGETAVITADLFSRIFTNLRSLLENSRLQKGSHSHDVF